jgi:tRNA-specific 2-thiouridylase
MTSSKGPASTHIVVGLSGGVDSAVAAALLLRDGYRVSALFMKNWEEYDAGTQCSAAEDLAEAQKVCTHLCIPLHTVNFSHEYWERVFEHFLAELRAGRTPNPDVLCNREIKFRAFLDHARVLGADAIATGHYARVSRSEKAFHLLKGRDPGKDQSYFLYALGQEALGATYFPVGNLLKQEVRQLAREFGLPNHARRDSTGICFIGERDFRDFLARYLPRDAGDIVSVEGERKGRHSGLAFYTIGQREGLGIGGPGAAWYVVDKRMADNTLVVAQGDDHPALHAAGLIATDPRWISGHAPGMPLRCTVKIRYRQQDVPCTLIAMGETLEVRFDLPQRAVTPGQFAVFYNGDECLGGSVIERRVA